MAMAYKCDRCGKLFEKDKNYGKYQRAAFQFKIWRIPDDPQFKIWRIKDGSRLPEVTLDLCESCQYKLFNFVHNLPLEEIV